jgi:nicotinamidase-related amidase
VNLPPRARKRAGPVRALGARRKRGINGSAPDTSSVALLLVDVINEFAFPKARALLRRALPMARALQRLKQRAKSAGVPIVYVNDNFGRWRSDFNAIVRHCARRDSRGRHVVQLLRPEADDYFVLKPKHSGFYESSLGVLLDHLGVRRLIVTGLTTPQCVLFTAGDAHMRDFELAVPRDCVAAADAGQHRQALTFMSRFFAADTRPSTHRALRRLRRR